MAQLLDITNINLVKQQIEKDILESATIVNSQELEKLHINVITDLENENDVIVFERRKGTARKYNPNGMKVRQSLGSAYVNQLKVTLAADLLEDNIQNYRVKEGWSILGSNGEYDPKGLQPVEFALRQIGMRFGQQTALNLFHGVASDSDSELAMYDGLLKQITAHQTAGRISASKGNLVDIDLSLDIANCDNDDLRELYRKYVKFYNSINPLMRMQGFDIWVSPAQFSILGMAYAATFQSVNPDIILSNNFKFTHMPQANFVQSDLMGTGAKAIATVPYNFDFATDLTSADTTAASVKLWQHPDDANKLRYQVQAAFGTRLRQSSADKFCCTTGTLTPLSLDTWEPGSDVVENSNNKDAIIAALEARIAALEEAGE